MKILFAPMEGITGYTFRNVHHRFYGGISAYYTPFLTARQTRKWKSREGKEIDPANNAAVPVVPQVLTSHAADFLWAAENLAAMGYREINLNLGCPSATVVTKHKGAGFLADPDALDMFFREIFAALPDGTEVSVKTRLGMTSPEEMKDLLPVFNRYPLKKLIVHPRTREDFYSGPVHMDAFRMVYENSVNSVVYNGEIRDTDDVLHLMASFPGLQEIMIGRGLIARPDLGERIEQVLSGKPAISAGQAISAEQAISGGQAISGRKTAGPAADERTRCRAFHDALLRAYQQDLKQPENCLMKMKELWGFWAEHVPASERQIIQIKKSRTIEAYRTAAQVLREVLDRDGAMRRMPPAK